MKHFWSYFLFVVFISVGIYSQSPTKSMTLQGPIGLILVPTAYTPNPFGIAVGGHYMSRSAYYMLGKFTLAPVSNWEIGGVYDKRENVKYAVMVHTKYVFYKKNIRVGIGANLQLENEAPEDAAYDNKGTRYQAYIVATWKGFFETSAMLGKTFGDDTIKDNIDFGIGFQRSLFFERLKWMVDFANYNTRYNGYVGRLGGSSGGVIRGIFNTGFRVEIIKKRNIYWNIDLLYLDVLDDSRHFGGGTTITISF